MTCDSDLRIVIVVPCRNEAPTIGAVVERFGEALPSAQVHVFDNDSSDATAAAAARAGARVHRVALRGKGNVLRRMFADVDADVYVLVDGDDTYDAASAPAMVDLLCEQGLDMVIGVREATAAAAYRRGHAFGNRLLTGFLSRLFGRNCSDILSGYRVFSRRFAKSFPVFSRGFEIETELTVHALEMSMPVGEIVTPYRERPQDSASKLHTWTDGLRILVTMLRLFSTERPFAFYGAISIVLAITSVLLAVPIVNTYLETGLVPRFPTAILSTGLMLLAALSFFAGLILANVTRGRRELKALFYLQQQQPQRCAPSGRDPYASAPASTPHESLQPMDAGAGNGDSARTGADGPSYSRRIDNETAIFSGQVQVHDLPPIFHYWSNKYLRTDLESFGFSNPDEFFTACLARTLDDTPDHVARFVSLGAGNCDTEVRVASALVARGKTNFVLECVDLNATMLERGRELARTAGLDGHILPVQADFNTWRPGRQYSAVMANQSLHHVLELERLFDAVHGAMLPDAVFVASDIIGRNGHQRWPEALAIVREFWRELPPAYRYNIPLRRQEDEFLDWDCSGESFEGIRAQDILPLLIERFGFELFIGFANVIDPFVDRSFGHHFKADAAWDREFIDRVHARDEAELLAGTIKPTHMLAVMRAEAVQNLRCRQHLTPAFCVRPPD